MGLSGALFSSVSGLDATGTAISVIGDNIANVNTPGFKARRAEFADVLGQSIASGGGFSQLGAGTTTSRIATVFSQGTFETTARTTDLAIEGRGFFIVDGNQGRSYTRAGIFGFDQNGFLVDPSGSRVQGFGIDPVTQLPLGTLGDIQLSTSLSAPRSTTDLTLSVNLDSGVLPPGPFDPADPSATSNFSTPVTLYDSLGNGHAVSVYYTNTGPGTWDWNAAVAQADTTDPLASPGDQVVVQGSGTLTFDTDGNLQSTSGSPATFNFSGGGTAGQSVAIGFGPTGVTTTGLRTTQFADDSATTAFTQDGFAPGQLQSISVDPDGFITGSFSNGESTWKASSRWATTS
jgi:flagellar hook protein FlgE